MSSSPAGDRAPPGMWTCPVCTLHNDDNANSCQGCESIRPQQEDATTSEELESVLQEPLTLEAFVLEVDGFRDHGGRPRQLGQIADKEELVITESAAFRGTQQMSRICKLLKGRSLPPSSDALLRKAGLRRFVLANDATGADQVHAMRYALLCGKLLGCMETQAFDEAAAWYANCQGLPCLWDVRSMVASEGYCMVFKAPVVSELLIALQQLLVDTFNPMVTRDRVGELPEQISLKRATEVQNAENWAAYCAFKSTLLECSESLGYPMWCPGDIMTMHSSAVSSLPSLDPRVSEAWLFHGTSPTAAEAITSGDFRISLAGSNAGTLYGNGVYTAESCAKSDEYAARHETPHGRRFMILCRVLLGHMLEAKDASGDNAVRACRESGCHSILGVRKFRECMA